MGDPFQTNRQLQLGAESTPGTAVPANKLMTSMNITMDPTFNSTTYRASGRRFTQQEVPDGMESTSGKLSGDMTFTEMVYALSMIWGPAVITTPSGAVNARQWQWQVPLTGKVNPVSMTAERGDADDSERTPYSILSDIGFDMSRTASTLSGTLLSQAVQKAGGTWAGMTASPTKIPLVPVLPNKWAAYMDNAPQGAGVGTKLTRCFKAVFAYGGAFVPYWAMDPAQTSYAGAADVDGVKTNMVLTLLKDTIGEGLWTPARAAQTKYLRLLAAGDSAENFRTITTTGVPTGGNFTLVYGGITSGAISFNSTAGQLQPILDAMSSLGLGNTTVSGGPLPTALRVDFKGARLNDPATNLFTLGTNGLTGGASPQPVFAAPFQLNSSFQLDMAGKVSKAGAEQDLTSVRVRDWTFEVVEDSSMNASAGGAITVTVINQLTAL